MLNDSNKISVAAVATQQAYMYSATGFIKSTAPNTLLITEVSHRVRADLLNDTGKDFFLSGYKSGKCTIADLIWWELEEVTE